MAKLTIEYATARLAANQLVDRIDDEGANGFTVWAKPGCGWKVCDSIRPATQFLPGTSAKHFNLAMEGLVRLYEPAAEPVAELEDIEETDPTYQEDCAGDAEHERRNEEGE